MDTDAYKAKIAAMKDNIRISTDDIVFVWDKEGNNIIQIVFPTIPDTAMFDYAKTYNATIIFTPTRRMVDES